MSDSISSLEIGGISTAVKVQADPTPLTTRLPSMLVAELAARLREAYENGLPWTIEMFSAVSLPAAAPVETSPTDAAGNPDGDNAMPAVPVLPVAINSSTVIKAIQLMVDDLNERRRLVNTAPFGPFEGDVVLAKCCGQLPVVWQRFIRWTFEVRIGLRRVAHHLHAATAMTHVMREGVLSLRDVVGDMGGSQLAIIQFRPGQKPSVPFRGYTAGFDAAGDGYIGTPAFNLWAKDGWQTPGIRSTASLAKSKERAMLRGREMADLPEAEQALLARTCEGVVRRVSRRRQLLGIAEGMFPEARSQRLDLENDEPIATFLDLVRAFRAHAVWKDATLQIRGIALRSKHSQAALRENPDLADHDADLLRQQLAIAQAAEGFHKHVAAFTFPSYYLGFSPTTVPRVIDESKLVILATCDEQAYPVELLSKRSDRAGLVFAKSTIRKIEDFTPIVQLCGSLVFGGKLVTDTHRVFRNAKGELLDERGDCKDVLDECMLFLLEGEVEPRVLPIDAWLDQLGYRLTPQVVDSGESRTAPELLQGHENGMYISLSERDIKPEFMAWGHPRQRS